MYKGGSKGCAQEDPEEIQIAAATRVSFAGETRRSETEKQTRRKGWKIWRQ